LQTWKEKKETPEISGHERVGRNQRSHAGEKELVNPVLFGEEIVYLNRRKVRRGDRNEKRGNI